MSMAQIGLRVDSTESTPPNPAISLSDSDSFSLDTTIAKLRSHSRTFSHYELQQSLGEGDFGSVWKAKDLQLNRIVALKLPHLAHIEERHRLSFMREARATAALKHPNIVQIFGVVHDGSHLAIISQFIDGQTLSQRIHDQRPTFEESAQLLVTVADAVHHAHDAGIIHRDLKPSNILLDAEGRPHVSDFGLAKWIGDEGQRTHAGSVVGTPAYMSPEQARGDSHLVDRRSDVYSLGVLLYELLVGKPPFEGKSTLLLHQIQSQEPKTLRSQNSEVPHDLETICLKCLSKAPEDRYASAEDLAADLKRYLSNEPILSRPVTLIERWARWTKQNLALSLMAAATVLSTLSVTVLGASMLFTTTSSTTSQSPTSVAMPSIVPAAPMDVTLATEPAGATVVFYPLDLLTGEPILDNAVRPSGKSPVQTTLTPGDYLVVTALPDGRFHEVYRHVPREPGLMAPDFWHSSWTMTGLRSVELHSVKICDSQSESEMSFITNDDGKQSPTTLATLTPFFLDRREVTIGELIPQFGNQLPGSLRNRTELLSNLNLPITGVFIDEAMLFAELVGKRLPTAREYEFAATNGGTTLFPWGDSEPPSDAWQLSSGYKAFDETLGEHPVYGLFSNASEYVISGAIQPTPDVPTNLLIVSPINLGEFVRGGPTSEFDLISGLQKDGARRKTLTPRMAGNRYVGFRCAKSKSPRL